MSKTNPNDLMHPTDQRTSVYADVPNTMLEGGLTKREYFAAMAMQAYLSQAEHYSPIESVVRAVESADALIEELNKEKV